MNHCIGSARGLDSRVEVAQVTNADLAGIDAPWRSLITEPQPVAVLPSVREDGPDPPGGACDQHRAARGSIGGCRRGVLRRSVQGHGSTLTAGRGHDSGWLCREVERPAR